nr:MAG TPA: hypothetical protein [Caudoviricetes sp.]
MYFKENKFIGALLPVELKLHIFSYVNRLYLHPIRMHTISI